MNTKSKKKSIVAVCFDIRHQAKFLLVALSFLALLGANSHAATIYRETFGFTGGSPSVFETTAFSTVGWTNLYSIAGGNIEPDSAPDGYYLGVSNETGSPVNLPNVNAGGTSASEQYGVVRLANLDGLTFKTLVYTSEYSVNRSAFQVDTLSWYGAGTGGGSDQDSLSAAVKINGAWYVSQLTRPNALQPNSTSSFGDDALPYTVDFNTANWFSLAADVGSPFAVGVSPLTLPNGDIEAFGMYADLRPSNGSYLMFDTFQIDASTVPEPATTAMIALGVCAAAFFRHRASKARV